jgi:hypothetical protein
MGNSIAEIVQRLPFYGFLKEESYGFSLRGEEALQVGFQSLFDPFNAVEVTLFYRLSFVALQPLSESFVNASFTPRPSLGSCQPLRSQPGQGRVVRSLLLNVGHKGLNGKDAKEKPCRWLVKAESLGQPTDAPIYCYTIILWQGTQEPSNRL